MLQQVNTLAMEFHMQAVHILAGHAEANKLSLAQQNGGATSP